MKTTYLFLCLTLLGGCISSQYYQIHEITSTEVSNTMEYENSEVKITYNFWSELGNSKCLIFNKTDSLIFFHMDLSHFVFNGLAYPYYTNKVTSLGTELSRSNTEDFTIDQKSP